MAVGFGAAPGTFGRGASGRPSVTPTARTAGATFSGSGVPSSTLLGSDLWIAGFWGPGAKPPVAAGKREEGRCVNRRSSSRASRPGVDPGAYAQVSEASALRDGQARRGGGLSFHDHLLWATKTTDKRAALRDADFHLERLKVYNRLYMRLKLSSFDQYEYLAAALTELGRMLGGWQRSLKRLRPSGWKGCGGHVMAVGFGAAPGTINRGTPGRPTVTPTTRTTGTTISGSGVPSCSHAGRALSGHDAARTTVERTGAESYTPHPGPVAASSW